MGAKGFKEQVLIPALTQQGLSVREARRTIDAIFGSIKDALRRHECVELPIGTFKFRRQGSSRGWRFGKVVLFRRCHIEFLPDAELDLAAAASPCSLPRPKRKKKAVKNEFERSVKLIVDFVRDNIDDRKMFFDELYDGPTIPGMFKRALPKASEIRPLGQAAQVIKEFKPNSLPVDDFERFYACVDWFAHWSQRVIPLQVWQEALQQAKKILLP